ncbi:hypothetical protein KY285_035415 [Solanum tuberosum]|nr:hypothetical protein KY285_035415 [Solanum tuberosum]
MIPVIHSNSDANKTWYLGGEEDIEAASLHNYKQLTFSKKKQPHYRRVSNCVPQIECCFYRRPSTTEEILTIDIKPGWKKGTKITFPEKGNEQRGIIPSDLVFIIDEKPHSVFKRDGNDLVVTQKIPLVEALTGYTAQITTLDGRNLTVPINSIISPNYEEVIKGEGMPIPKEPSRKGNLRVKFNIKFPSKLTSEQKAGIKRYLT